MPRLAWFTPLPPQRSGIAAYSAELLPLLAPGHEIEVFLDTNVSVRTAAEYAGRPRDARLDRAQDRLGGVVVRAAEDFPWRHRRQPYDLIVYQLGNADCHDYMWAYMARYPGLTVLHDAQVHQARAKALLRDRTRLDDYRREFAYNHPDAPPSIADIVIAGFGGRLYYLWPFLRIVVECSRVLAVHNPWVAARLTEQFPGVAIDTIRMGVPPIDPDAQSAADVRVRHGIPDGAVVFAAYGLATPEKRLTPIVKALTTLADRLPIHLLVVGDRASHYDVMQDAAECGVEDRVHVTGYVPDEELASYLLGADVCLCLRWPTCREMSASWLRCLAAGKPTIVTDLIHMRDVPAIDPRTWQPLGGDLAASAAPPLSVAIDLIDEQRCLELAMQRLATDLDAREALGQRAKEYWRTRHTLDHMREDYERVIARALSVDARPSPDLPAHLFDDGVGLLLRVCEQFGVTAPF